MKVLPGFTLYSLFLSGSQLTIECTTEINRGMIKISVNCAFSTASKPWIIFFYVQLWPKNRDYCGNLHKKSLSSGIYPVHTNPWYLWMRRYVGIGLMKSK